MASLMIKIDTLEKLLQIVVFGYSEMSTEYNLLKKEVNLNKKKNQYQ